MRWFLKDEKNFERKRGQNKSQPVKKQKHRNQFNKEGKIFLPKLFSGEKGFLEKQRAKLLRMYLVLSFLFLDKNVFSKL